MGESLSKASKAHMDRVREIGCILCRQMGDFNVPASAHHIMDNVARSDWLTIPLCHFHHQGGGGFHYLGEREFNRRYKTTEANLLAATLEAMNVHT